MAKKSLQPMSRENRDELERRVKTFNSGLTALNGCQYSVGFRGRQIYLHRADNGSPEPVCRLTYIDDVNDLEFAIYRYGANKYDPSEWMFPGSEEVDGTIEGAMKAGLSAYPYRDRGTTNPIRVLLRLIGIVR
jgi:hypothetical protein